MKKLLILSSFILTVFVLNFVSLDLLSEIKERGTVNKVEAYSLEKPKEVDSIECTPFYIYDGLKDAKVQVVGKTYFVTMPKSELIKMLNSLNAKLIRVENSNKLIFDYYSSRLNTVKPILINNQKVNMQIHVDGNTVKIGAPSLCGFI